MSNGPEIINIGHVSTPKLNVVSSKGTRNNQTKFNTTYYLPNQLTLDQELEMLMNPKKQGASPRKVVFEDLSSIEAQVNAATAGPKVSLADSTQKYVRGRQQ